MQSLSGVLSIDKAAGMTSHDVVARVRRELRGEYGKVKAGHAGTLDPDATGVLLVCLGAATRLTDLLAERGKTYHAGFQLGVATSSEDASGEIVAERDASQITREQVEAELAGLTGHIEQVPPMVSAVHHEGRRLYELARQGIEVERAARTIHIERIDLLRFNESGATHPTGEMLVKCGKGTYVRTLCADLGARLGVGGHMTTLRRLRVGAFDADSALPVEEITTQLILQRLVPAEEAAGFLPRRVLTNPEREDILHGRTIPRGEIAGDLSNAEWVSLIDQEGELVALAAPDEFGNLLLPKKVLAGS